MDIDIKNHLDKFEEHLFLLKDLQLESITVYRAHVKKFFAWYAGNVKDDVSLAEITRKDIEDFLKYCLRRGNGNQTRSTKLTALQRYFRYLKYAGVIPADPTADILRPSPRNDLLHKFTREDILRLFSVIDITREKGLRDATFLILGAFAGLRANEMTRLNVEAVSDDGKYLTVVKSTKGVNRTVRIWSAPSIIVRKLLAARLAQGARKADPLLTSYWENGQPRGNRRLTASMLDALIKALANRAEIKHPAITTHMLRVAHVFDLQHVKGFDTPQIMRRLGWRTLYSVPQYFDHFEDISQEYRSLDEYWLDFIKIWITKGSDAGK